MKKLYTKDKNARSMLLKFSIEYFILKTLTKNKHIFNLLKRNALLKLVHQSKKFSKICIVNRCIVTFNKKRFNKFTLFSRFLFLKLLRIGKISGFMKSSW